MNASRLVSSWAFGLAVVAAGTAQAQTPDDAVTMLGASSFRTRAVGVAVLNRVPVSALPSAAPVALMSLLEREATGQVTYNETTADGDESWQEYIVDLSAAVLRLRDSRSLRGLTLLGIETSREAQEYVASLGPAALPALNQAWHDKEIVRPDVILTWGSLLTVSGANTLNSTDRVGVLSRLATAAQTYALSVAGAARRARLVVLAPLIGQVADTTSDETVRARLQRIATDLRAQRDVMTASEVLSQVDEWLGGLCVGATGPRNGACISLDRLLSNAMQQIRDGNAPAARGTVNAAAERVEAARTTGSFIAAEATTLELTLEYLLTRI